MKFKKLVLYVLIALSPFLATMICFYVIAGVGAAKYQLKGRRGGPYDAFRHTYASAVISRYLGPSFVDTFTLVTEKDDTSIYDLMDRHNNMIGKNLGQRPGEIFELVAAQISSGTVNSVSAEQTTWLESHLWQDWDFFN